MAAGGYNHGSEPPRPAVLYALPDERRFFGSEYHSLAIFPGGGIGAAADGRLQPASLPGACVAYAACIGVGPENAYRNTRLLLQCGISPGALIVVGFAGGLRESAKPGSIVVADKVLDAVSRREDHADPELLAFAARVNLPSIQVSRGVLAAADHVLVRAAEKQEFARETGAIAVDMESGGAIAAATEFGVPWLAVRAITDGVDDDLPFDFNAPEFKDPSDPGGGVDRGRIVARTLLHPWKIPGLIRLGMRSSLAARNLAAFLQALLRELPAD